MTNIVVDTNVFLSLLLQQSPEHTKYANKVFSAVLDDDLNICVPVQSALATGLASNGLTAKLSGLGKGA